MCIQFIYDGAILKDTISPNNPVIEVVTVTAGQSVINWTSTSLDVHAFAIYILGEDGVANILGLNMQTLMNSTID